MITCDDYQNKVVVVLDSESSEQDEKLLFAHLAECPECRAFHAEVTRNRRLFSVVIATKTTVAIGQDFMRTVEADALRSKALYGKKEIRSHAQFWDKHSRVILVGGLAAALLVIVSWLACYAMSRETAELREQLQGAQKDLAVALAQGQLEEDRDREQRAITALYLRMAELEQRVERVSHPRNTLLPAEQYGLSGKQDDL